MVGHGGSSAGSYLADPTSPIPSHCASIVVISTLRVKYITVMDLCIVLDESAIIRAWREDIKTWGTEWIISTKTERWRTIRGWQGPGIREWALNVRTQVVRSTGPVVSFESLIWWKNTAAWTTGESWLGSSLGKKSHYPPCNLLGNNQSVGSGGYMVDKDFFVCCACSLFAARVSLVNCQWFHWISN